MSDKNPYAEVDAAERALLLATLKLRSPFDAESVEDFDKAVEWLARLRKREEQLEAAIRWAHGFMSNTDKAAADRLFDLADMHSYSRERWISA